MTEIELSVIDISQFPQEFEGGAHFQYHPEVAKLREACKEWGFFRVVNHGIPVDFLQSIVSVSRDLLSLPVEVKDRAVSSNPMESYFRSQESPPNQQCFCFPDMPNQDSIQEISGKLWPQEGNSNFCEAIGTYGSLLTDLSTKIIKFILASLGLDPRTFYQTDFENFSANLYITGSSSHGKCTGDESLPSHADSGCLTILYNDENEGLEIRSKEGKWVNIKPAPASFIVNIGDSMKAWSNGRYRSADHRVVYKGWKNRLSLPFLRYFPADALIWAPEELVDEDNPRRYKSFTHSYFWNEFTKNEAIKEFLQGQGEFAAQAIDRIAGI